MANLPRITLPVSHFLILQAFFHPQKWDLSFSRATQHSSWTVGLCAIKRCSSKPKDLMDPQPEQELENQTSAQALVPALTGYVKTQLKLYLRVLRLKKKNKQQWIGFDPAEASWLWEMELLSHYFLGSFFSAKRERLTWWRVCSEASHSCQLQSAYFLSPSHFSAIKKSRKMGEREWGQTLSSPVSITQSAPQQKVSSASLDQTTADFCKKPLEQQHICNGNVSLGLELHQGTCSWNAAAI